MLEKSLIEDSSNPSHWHYGKVTALWLQLFACSCVAWNYIRQGVQVDFVSLAMNSSLREHIKNVLYGLICSSKMVFMFTPIVMATAVLAESSVIDFYFSDYEKKKKYQ